MNDVVDFSKRFEPGEFPCCPLCDNEIEAHEPASIIQAHGSIAAAHDSCIFSERQEMGI